MADACSDCGVTAEAVVATKIRRKSRVNGMNETEGKAARVAASECGQRASFNDEIRSGEVFIRKVRRMAKKVRSKKEKLRSDRGKIALAARLSSQYYRELWTHKSTSVLGP